MTPARVAYNANHPTFSARIPRDLYDRVLQLRESTRKSLATILAEAIGAQEVSAGRAAELARAAAVKKYATEFGCCICGEAMYLLHPEAKRVAGESLTSQGWGHATCIDG